MVSNSYLQARREDARRLQSIIDNGVIHNYDAVDLSIIKSASLSPNGFAYVQGNCFVVCRKPNTTGFMIHHYIIFDL